MSSSYYQNRVRVMSASLLALGVLAASPSHADIKYTQVMKMADGTPANSITKYVKQNAERTETNMKFGPVEMKTISIRLCEKNQSFKIDPRLKIYTLENSGSGAGETGAAQNGASAKPAGNTGAAGTGKMTVTSTVQDLGTGKVAGFETRHYMITSKMQSSGCAGNSSLDSKMEVWVADIRDAVPCQQNGPNYAEMAGGNSRSDCKIAFEQKGDTAAISKVYSGLVMRMKMYNGNQVIATQEVSMLSQAKLDDEPFAVPADYKQVSEQEFQQAQQRAMMEAMTQQTQAAAKDDNDAPAQDAVDDEDAGDKADDAGDDAEKNEEQEKPKEEKKPIKKPKLGKFKLPF
jgi:hypothetical protein